MTKEDLSPEEKEVNKLINEAKEKIELLERQIKEQPKDQGPAPRYNMPGGPQPNDPARHAKIIQDAKETIEKEKDDLAQKVDKTLVNSSKEVKERAQGNLTNYLYGGKADKNERAKQKDLSSSEAFAMKLRYGHTTKDPVIPDHERARTKDLSASQEFAMKLRFKDSQQPVKDALEKDQPAKEGKSEMMSMSAQFSQSLKYSQVEEKERNQPEKEDVEKDKPETQREPEKE